MSRKPQIFISYSSSDKELVDCILHKIEDLNVQIWKAPESVRPGSNYAREIPKAIQESALFLLMLSEKSQKSIWVEKEVDTAVSARVSIIPLQLDEEPMSDMYRFYLNTVQMISYRADPDKALEELRSQIRKITNDNGHHGREDGNAAPSGAAANTNPEKQTSYEAGKAADRSTASKGARQTPPSLPPRLIKTNELRKNKIPLYCEKCGCLDLKVTSLGEYTCTQCGHKNYDDFSKIRNYMKEAGNSSVIDIARETGVSRDRVNAYLEERKEEEVPSVVTVCRKCGKKIMSGFLCRECAARRSRNEEDGKRFHIIRTKR